MAEDMKMINDMVADLSRAWPFNRHMDPVARVKVYLAAADDALVDVGSEPGTRRRAAVLGIQHEIATLIGRLDELPTDGPAEVSTD